MYYIQLIILISGGLALWFLSANKPWSKYGHVIGLLGQPLWLYCTVQNRQWGMFTLAVWYSYCFLRGIFNTFIKDRHSLTTLCKDGVAQRYIKVIRRKDGSIIRMEPIKRKEYETAKQVRKGQIDRRLKNVSNNR